MKEKTRDSLKKCFKIILGLLLIMAGVYACIRWWPHLLSLIMGAIGPNNLLGAILCLFFLI